MRISYWSSDVCSSDLIYLIEMMARTANISEERVKSLFQDIHDQVEKFTGDDLRRMRRIMRSRKAVVDRVFDQRQGIDILEKLNLSKMRERLLRSEERRVGKECEKGVDLGGRRR